MSAAPAEVEAVLLLDHHRQVGRQVFDRADVHQLPAERTHGEIRHELRPTQPRRDDQHVVRDGAGVGALAHLHPTLGRAADELARDRPRLGDAVLDGR